MDTDEDSPFGVSLDCSDDEVESNEPTTGSVEYELLTTSDLHHEMKNDIIKVSNVLHVSEAIAKCISSKCEWNVNKVMSKYCDLNSFLLSLNTTSCIPDYDIQPTNQREICLIPLVETKVTSFKCGHQFCDSCCSEYFRAKVLNDGVGNEIKCPALHCNMLIDDAIIIELIPENAKQTLLQLIAHAFVATNPLLQHCPSEGCEYTIKAKTLIATQAVCRCGFESCLQCGEIWHDVITCSLLKKWISTPMDDVENNQWLKANAKKCPN